MAPSEFMFAGSANKLKREQKERMEKARQKASKERLAEQRVRESREAMEREQQRKRLAEAAALEAVCYNRSSPSSSCYEHYENVFFSCAGESVVLGLKGFP